MDSLSTVIAAADRGGPSGEIRVRQRLQAALEARGVECDVAGSDEEMLSLVQSDGTLPHDIIIMDEWTAVSPGGAPRPFLRGREGDTFLLAFFGLRSGALASGALTLPHAHVLTAFPTSLGGTFLGFDVAPRWSPRAGQCPAGALAAGGAVAAACAAGAAAAAAGAPPLPPRIARGVVWGKKPDYFAARGGWLRAAAELAPLHTTASAAVAGDAPLKHHGHLGRGEWDALLAGSAFFLGLGDPLLGPSALDALGAGAVFVNPTFEGGAGGVRTELQAWGSQHPFLASMGAPYVCNARLDDGDALRACVEGALALDLPPLVPAEFSVEAYAQRVDAIFGAWLK
jgi:hypothetical protein